MQNRRFPNRILCLALACLLLCLSCHAAERASLFLGDSAWEEDSLLPFLEAEGKQLVPVSAFEGFGSITVARSDLLGSLLFSGEGGYLSYNLNFGTCLADDGSVTAAEIYRYGGELYLAPEPICTKFGLTFTTTYAADGYLAARITDGSETLTFGELLSLYTETKEDPLPYLYNPTGRTVGGTFLYPVLLMPAVANIGNLLPLLEQHPMTFAIPPKNVSRYGGMLAAIYAAGHTVAYYMDPADLADPESFLAEMTAANEYLFALLGKTVRVYVSTVAYPSMPSFEGYYKKACRMHLVADDLRNEKIVRMTLHDAPLLGVYNFSLASDRETRLFYSDFFKKFDATEGLRSMPLTEASPNQ